MCRIAWMVGAGVAALAPLVGVACSTDADHVPAVAEAADAGDARKSVDLDAELPPVELASGPALLSETGLYSNFAARTIAPDLIAFAPRYSFWSDGAEKRRWLSLPPGTKIDTSKMDDWVFPIGTKVWKEFRVGDKLVETRLLMKVRDDAPAGWWMAAYVWKEDGSDAVASPKGVDDALGTGHLVPSRVDCQNCHQGMRDVLIGVSAIQLSHTGEGYAFDAGTDAGADADIDGSVGTGDAGDAGDPEDEVDAGGDAGRPPSALQALAAAGKLTDPPASDFDVPGTGAVKDALAYLHVNCGSCHNDESIRLNTQTRMRLRLLVDQTSPEQTGAYTTTIGTVMKHPMPGSTDVLVPGSPEASGLWLRMGRRDFFAMPPAGTKLVDDDGVEIVRRWIVDLH
jgi:hypothetical protein